MIKLYGHLRVVRMTLLMFGLALLVVVSVRASVSAPFLAPITQWNSAPSLPAPVSPAAVAINRPSGSILIVAGGRNTAGNPVRDVRRASVLTNGSISTWADQPLLSVALFNHTLVASSDGNYLFVITGWNGTNRVRDVWRATVAANGSVGAWSKMTNRDYPIAVATADGVVVGGRVYVVGGTDSTGTPRRNIYSATIASDGSLGAWRPERDLQKGLSRHAVTAYNGFLYVTGGDDGAIAQNTIYYAQINTDGSLAGWQTATLPARRLYHRAVIQDNQLVILGGSTDNVNGQNTVYRAPINANGSLGAWATQQPMPKALFRQGAVVVPKNGSEYVFVLGGLQGANSQNTVYYSNVPKPLRYLPLIGRQATSTPTRTPTRTPTWTPTQRPVNTSTYTPTPTHTPSPTVTGTATPTATSDGCVRRIEGTVFVDVNNNSVPDPGEQRLSGVEIKLTGPSTNLSTFTNPSGTYGFDNLAPGTYQVVETQPAGYISLPQSPDTVPVVIAQCPSVATNVDFREIESAPTPTQTNTPTLTPTPTITPTPTSTPQTAPALSIEVANVPSASPVNVNDPYWYDVTVTNTSVGVSLSRIVLTDEYNPTQRGCVVAVSSSNPGCSLNALAKKWECDILQTNVIPNGTFSVRFFYQAADNCSAAQNANKATAVGYHGASASPPVSASANVTIN